MPDTTNRPTPEQVVDRVSRWDLRDLGPSVVLDDLRAAGYVIVHPDDVPVKSTEWAGITADPTCREPMRSDGWNACRARIFGDDQ